jgi:colanic acid biosynthesis glycosyl transferase WcaI
VVTVKRGLEGVVVPSKVYNILAAGRPLLVVATHQTEVARLADRDGCGIAADPDDAVSVANAVRSVMDDSTRLSMMSRRARELAQRYDRVKQLQTFVEAVEGACLEC